MLFFNGVGASSKLTRWFRMFNFAYLSVEEVIRLSRLKLEIAFKMALSRYSLKGSMFSRRVPVNINGVGVRCMTDSI